MTDENRAELRRVVEALVRRSLCDDATNVYIGSNGSGDGDQMYFVTSFKSDESVALPPLTTAQQLALSVLIGEPDTVIQSALADMLLDMGHEYATAVAEKARAEEREKPAHLSPGSAVTVYGLSGRVLDVNIGRRLDGLMECEIRVGIYPEGYGGLVPARSDSTRNYQFDMPIHDSTTRPD